MCVHVYLYAYTYIDSHTYICMYFVIFIHTHTHIYIQVFYIPLAGRVKFENGKKSMSIWICGSAAGF